MALWWVCHPVTSIFSEAPPPTGHVRLVTRTSVADPETLEWLALDAEEAPRVAPGIALALTLTATADTVAGAINGRTLSTMPREPGAGVGVPGVWTAGTGGVMVEAFRVELRR